MVFFRHEGGDSVVRLMTVKDAARECGVSEYFLRNWIRRGECPGVYSGTRFLINVDKLEQKIREGSSGNK